MFEEYAFNVAIVFCFLTKGDDVLLIRRGNPPYQGQWTVPGGKKERGENLSEACARELYEETGFILERTALAGIVTNVSEASPHDNISFYFKSNSFSGSLTPSSEGKIEWCDIKRSLTKERISPFYTLIAPLVYGGEGRIFEGSIRIDERGRIAASHIAYL